MLIDPTATATATVASRVPRQRMAMTTTNRRAAQITRTPGHAGHRRAETDQRDAEPDRVEDEQRRDAIAQPGRPR